MNEKKAIEYWRPRGGKWHAFMGYSSHHDDGDPAWKMASLCERYDFLLDSMKADMFTPWMADGTPPAERICNKCLLDTLR